MSGPRRRNAHVMHQQVLDLLDADAIARDTLAFVQVPSETGAEGPGGEHFAALCERAGLEVEVDRFIPDRPNVYARHPGSESGRPLLLNGHVDTIPRGASDPPEMRDGWVVGRGAEEMKGGLVAMVHAAMALRRAGVRLRSDLWLTGVVGHETPVGKKEGPKRLVERIHA
ncbi:MAG: M20/M25/M40 family metallo-hydrolase, partial [Chloroflexi bacterium]|nr:M20/M25/M40 family metallo-hydrolase [Chloroflexota bacterium]